MRVAELSKRHAQLFVAPARAVLAELPRRKGVAVNLQTDICQLRRQHEAFAVCANLLHAPFSELHNCVGAITAELGCAALRPRYVVSPDVLQSANE